ncbi:aldo/keto reductase [Myxococcota bacterium]
MLYRTYGKTGRTVSAIGFGAMRFANPTCAEASVETMLRAHALGINYFDTAPHYCDDLSEDIVGRGLCQLPRGSFHVATKSAHHDGREVREQLERSRDRLRVNRIDFFHVWCLMDWADWEARRKGGAVEAALRARQDGLVAHLVCSSHMPGDVLERLLAEGIFEGVTLGYNAINFPYREQAVRAAGAHGLGVVAMNPLAGGVIPRNSERFGFLQDGGSVLAGALRFVAGDPDITSALVGFADTAQVEQAVHAIQGFAGYGKHRLNALRQQIEVGFDGLCTGCRYCLPCPQGIPVPQYMDVANQVLLGNNDPVLATDRFRWHWQITEDLAARCNACGDCEARCTQHLPIQDRLRSLPVPRTASEA